MLKIKLAPLKFKVYHTYLFALAEYQIPQEKINRCHHMGNAWVSP